MNFIDNQKLHREQVGNSKWRTEIRNMSDTHIRLPFHKWSILTWGAVQRAQWKSLTIVQCLHLIRNHHIIIIWCTNQRSRASTTSSTTVFDTRLCRSRNRKCVESSDGTIMHALVAGNNHYDKLYLGSLCFIQFDMSSNRVALKILINRFMYFFLIFGSMFHYNSFYMVV